MMAGAADDLGIGGASVSWLGDQYSSASMTHGDGRVGRIGRVVFQVAIKIIDLEKDRVAVGLERAKVVLFMRVVGVVYMLPSLRTADRSL